MTDVRGQNERQVWAYVDECGNTGINLFDRVQPNFVTAAILTKTNFDLTRQGTSAPLPNGQLIVAETLPLMGLPVSNVEPEGGNPLRLPLSLRSEL